MANLNYKCVIDCSRNSAKIILRYPSSHYIIDPQLLGMTAHANKFDPVLKIVKENEEKSKN